MFGLVKLPCWGHVIYTCWFKLASYFVGICWYVCVLVGLVKFAYVAL